MINQVTIEGYVVSRWDYKGDAFIRIAHHRPYRPGEIIHSDYITVKIDSAAKVPALQQGDRVRVRGAVWGKDILEPLGRVLKKARLNVELPAELENLIVPRPTAYILAYRLEFNHLKEEADQAALDAIRRRQKSEEIMRQNFPDERVKPGVDLASLVDEMT